jgi:hypothetical protein
MTLLRPNPVSVDLFMWDGATQTYVAEASDLGLTVGANWGFGRVYDDACDVGLTLVSTKSPEHEIVFAVEVEATEDNDILWWDLIPAQGQMPCLFTVRVFND